MKKLNKDQLLSFAKQCRLAESIQFDEIASSMDFNWFKQIKPRLATDPDFREEMEEVLESLKYKLFQLLLKTGMDGKKFNRQNPEASYIKEVIKYIDSGALLGVKVKDEKPEEDEDPEAMDEHLTRLGLKGKENGERTVSDDSE